MTGRAALIECHWYFDLWWCLNWREADASYFGKPYKQAWSA